MRFVQLLFAATAIVCIAAGSPVTEHRATKLLPRTIEDAATSVDSAAKPAESAPGEAASAGGEGAAGGEAAAGEAAPPAAGNNTVTIQRGQTLSAIAEQFGTGICDIAKANNLPDPNLVEVGQTLTIPPPTATPDNASCLPPPPPPATQGCVLGGPDRLTIPSDGITAEQAAKFLNITQDAFNTANAANAAALPANSSEKLPGGSVMQVPVCPNSQCTIGQGTVQQGDVFDKIAAAAGSTTGQILALNPGIDRLNLAIGQTFTLPSNCQNVTADAGAGAGGNATAAAPADTGKDKDAAAKR